MPSHGTGEDHAFEVAPSGHEVFHLVAVGDAGHVLLDDGAVVQNLGDVVAGGSDQLDSARVGRVVGARSGECGQEGVMHVDDAGRVVIDEVGGENLHVAGQDNEFNVVAGEDFKLAGLGLAARGCGDRDMFKRDAVKGGQILNRQMIGHDDRNLAPQLAGAPAVEQVGHAVQILRAEEGDAGTRFGGGEFSVHAQFGG